ncbi:hypothetical protein ACHHYP_12775 [Achlya hypogyna]|uniref:Lipoxygenase domain-containing protein n=1 Tax=Achlya hypogyna TaxID=1202772 RepID=A0A1V9YGH0_ACHHY|nr:hypothetical protein ACHHYP_12775 [Achlya hypogyna]
MGNQPSTETGAPPLPDTKRANSIFSMLAFAKNPREAMAESRDTLGNLFLIESAIVSEKIVGFCGPEMLAQYDAQVEAGGIVRDGAFPAGIAELLGPILPALDGEIHAARKAAVMTAFSKEQLALYVPLIFGITQKEHAAWAAHGGAISLALLSKKLVFKVFLAVLYGIETDTPAEYEAKYDHFRDVVDGYIHAIPKSAKAPDADGLRYKARAIDELIAPALAASQARIEAGTPRPCVLDYWVQHSGMQPDDICLEAFHALFAGLGGVQCLVVNTITAMATNPGAAEKLHHTRAEYVLKYHSAEDRSSHFDQLGYANQFLLEVKRFYMAGPSQLFGRTTAELTFQTPDGTYSVPKGALAVAGLNATNKHPEVWADPRVFNPDRFADFDADADLYKLCPHAIGKTNGGRRCAGQDLATAVMQASLVSLFDFKWTFVPGQDFTLETGKSTPMPVGNIMVTAFQHRHEVGEDGCDVANWHLLNMPEAKALAGVAAQVSDDEDDARLDLWTRLMIKLIGKKQSRWNKPVANEVLTIPKSQVTLPKITLIQTDIQVATEDEDWPNQPWLEIQQSNFLRDYAPFVDNFEHTWLPGEDMERYVMSKLGHMWPRVNVHWNDRYSDRALELLAFHGFGQHLLQKLPESHDDGSYYGIELDFMRTLEVRPGFAKYGADAYFNENGKVTKIVRGGVTSRPGDATWEYAKLCFRGSLQTKITAVDHLLGVHATVANIMVMANREQLPPTHPLRRLIKPFTFRSIAINYGAGRALFWPKGMLQRAYALTDKGMKQTWDFGLSHFKYETFPEHIARQNIDTTTLPFHEDGMDYWTIVRTFVSNYVDLYYKAEADVENDADLHAFWSYIGSMLPVPMRKLTLENLKDFVAHFIFLVSSMHNHLGTIAEYVSDPAFCPSSWVEGELAGRPGTAVRLALIMTATGFAQPAITEDFSHIMLDDAAKAVCLAFTKAVTDQIAVVDARNASRVQPFQSFNPNMTSRNKVMALPDNASVSLRDLVADATAMAELRLLLSNQKLMGAYGARLLAVLEEQAYIAQQPAVQRRPPPATEWTGGLHKLQTFAKDPCGTSLALHAKYGDIFFLDSVWSSTMIAGVAGPSLLMAFDDHWNAGRLGSAVPSGVLPLLGPVLPTLDGSKHRARKAALLAGVVPATHAVVIANMVADELEAWAAAECTFSFVVRAQSLALKLLLRILLGITGASPLLLGNCQHWIDTLVAAVPASTVAPVPQGLLAKERLLADLCRPAVAASRTRFASKAAVTCVLDALVERNELPDEVLALELLHCLCTGVAPLGSLLANTVTASHKFPAVWSKLQRSASAYTQSKIDGALWEYGSHFAMEVQRFYSAGSSLRYGRAKTDLIFTAGEVVYTLPKDSLVVAGVRATHVRAASWAVPHHFNPDRFAAGVEKGAWQPLRLGGFCDALSTRIVEAWALALTNYSWHLVPGQDFAVDRAVPSSVPAGKLVASHFRRIRPAVAASPAQCLALPSASEYTQLIAVAGDVVSKHDPRLDFWTREMYKLVVLKLSRWSRPEASKALTIPATHGPIDKITLVQTSIQVPLEDEDWPNQPWIEIKFANGLRDYAPFVDNFAADWLPGEDKERYVMQRFGHIWPRVQVHWDDRYSDRALELIAFNGLGQHMITKLPEAHTDGSYYSVATNFMYGLEVRPGFAKYGADAYFDSNGKVTKIVRGSLTFRPDDPDWEYAKLCFRGSLQIKVTALDHLLLVHSTVANHVTVLHREQLPPAHPLRRLIKPFTFRSAAINFSAGRALFAPKGMLQRTVALTTAGMKQAWDYGLASFAYEPFPAMIARQNIDTVSLPFHEDGMDYWCIVEQFVDAYIALYFHTDVDVTGDDAIVGFWAALNATMPYDLPALSLAALKEFITYFVFTVSSMHNHIGAIAEYVSDPAFCPAAWVEGELAGRPGTAIRLALLMIVTGFDQPQITEDFSHVMLDDDAKAVARSFTRAVTEQIAVVDARNQKRVQPFQSFNPSTMEMAVGI